jgi:protein-S-isoprenylcysteine O-methyltransferase Ste14
VRHEPREISGEIAWEIGNAPYPPGGRLIAIMGLLLFAAAGNWLWAQAWAWGWRPRAPFEERLLKRDLPGYADYTGRVRYRLIPGVW